jgi:diacylglycerol O-acyltransferase
MSPTDSVFLTIENRSQPMHVGGLHLYEPPEGAGPDYARDLYQKWISSPDVAPIFRKRPKRSLLTAGQWFWEDDEEFDIEHHVRRNALPQPGRVLELLALTSRLHGTLLDRQRPLWECHIIEGLNDGRLGMYFKIHHSLVDGMAALRLLQNALSKDPLEKDMPPPWATRPRTRRVSEKAEASLLEMPASAIRGAISLAGEAAGLPGALVKSVNRGLRDQAAPISFNAPKSMLNTSITGARRFAAQAWPIERLDLIRKSTGSSMNDVVLAMCSGALRTYMLDLDKLPSSPLVAMVPVALKAKELDRASGNAVGAVMVNLATHLDDPAERLATISKSMTDGKRALAEMSPLQILAMSGLGMSPLALRPLLNWSPLSRPPFNLIISNVPGPRHPLYLNGAKLAGMYPVSIPVDGQALNITCISYDTELAFGLTGCRRKVPHLQRLLDHLDTELSALELAAGIG